MFILNYGLCKGYRLCIMADFQNTLISPILSVSSSGFFAQNYSKSLLEWILTCCLEFLILTQSDDFAKAIDFAWWPTFKIVSFLEYLVFFQAVFCTELLKITSRMDFDMFFGILNFDPKWRFCKGYRLCTMADFQNCLISRILSDFSSGFLHRTTLNHF